MSQNKYDDPEWIAEKMFGEEFDSPIVYYVVDHADNFVLYYGSLDDCKQYQEQSSAGLSIVDYSSLTQEMISTISNSF